jgi:hypothetical protein
MDRFVLMASPLGNIKLFSSGREIDLFVLSRRLSKTFVLSSKLEVVESALQQQGRMKGSHR